MKNLILCSFLLLFVGFTYSQESVKLKEIGLEVMKEDLGKMNWEDAKKACDDLGDGWRLPTIDELNQMFSKYENLLGGFKSKILWSSYSEDSNDKARSLDFFDFGFTNRTTKNDVCFVVAVRDLK
jgi:hypothetical protein